MAQYKSRFANKQNFEDPIWVLWTIRTLGSPTANDILEAADAEPHSDVVQVIEQTMYTVSRVLNDIQGKGIRSSRPSEDYAYKRLRLQLQELSNAGLITQRFGRYQVSKNLDHLRRIFGISLTEYFDHRHLTPITTFPLFGTPQELQSKKWADVFVAMPFQESLKFIYEMHILETVIGLGLSCKRGDDFFSADVIMEEIWSAIFHAKLCIVDCTGRNPNVFYELGIAHTLGRKTVLIAQSADDIPFDIRHIRTIIYQPENMSVFESNLKLTIESTIGVDEPQA